MESNGFGPLPNGVRNTVQRLSTVKLKIGLRWLCILREVSNPVVREGCRAESQRFQEHRARTGATGHRRKERAPREAEENPPSGLGGESVSRPVSRVLYGAARMPHATTIHLGRPLPDASRNQPGRLAWKRAGTLADPAPPLFGFAPGGVYRAASVTGRAVGSYPTLSPLPRPKPGRFAFCGTFPGVAPAGRYPAPFFRGARTFLPRGVSALAGAAVRPADARLVGVQAGPVKPCRGRPPPAPTRLPRRSRAHPPPPVRQSR